MRKLLIEAVPTAAVLLAALAAAWPAYAVLLRARRGRARGSIAYLLGFFVGMIATAALAAVAGSFAIEGSPVPAAGMLASFIGPFIGMIHAKLRGPIRPRGRR